MTTKKELNALKKEIKALERKLDRFLKTVEKSGAKATKPSKAKAVKVPSKKAPAKKKATEVTATDQVLNIINRSKKGVNTATLMKKTGFNQKKVTNILHRTFKMGKIQRADKGIYVGVETKAPEASKEKAVKAKPDVKEPLKMGATKLTATDQVLEIVNTAKMGVDIITIKENTGFEDKKVRNIIFRATKEGKIQRAERGVYVGVKQD